MDYISGFDDDDDDLFLQAEQDLLITGSSTKTKPVGSSFTISGSNTYTSPRMPNASKFTVLKPTQHQIRQKQVSRPQQFSTNNKNSQGTLSRPLILKNQPTPKPNTNQPKTNTNLNTIAQIHKSRFNLQSKNSLLRGPPIQPKAPQVSSPHFNQPSVQQNMANIKFTTQNQPNPKVCLPPTHKKINQAQAPKVDVFCAKEWLYPVDLPKREYQLNIVKTALYHNTLVCLPTGLGKTFIAGVVMYNYYRWFPESKIIFMAPTKPLVHQQQTAFAKYVPIHSENIAHLSGDVPPTKRKELWKEKRVFFATPQTLNNDIKKDICDPSNIVCLILDEAHQAQGNYAYCAVVTAVAQRTKFFRILALTASPGADKKQVQKVLSNLRIARMEVRTEDSIDVHKYMHERKIDVFKVPLSESIGELEQLILTVLEAPIMFLYTHKVLFQSDPRKVSRFTLLKAKKTFNARDRNHSAISSVLEGKFNTCISLMSCYQLLHSHGIQTFSNRLLKFYEKAGATGLTSSRRKLVSSPDFVRLLSTVQKYTSMTQIDTSNPQANIEMRKSMHPKLGKLLEVLEDHFTSHSPITSRVMVFCHYRDTVNEIVELISTLPNVTAHAFLGQTAASKGEKKMTQKQQQEIVLQFKQGVLNTLVSTCIGEEGLDIGEVDLIICFDSQTSPTRIIQRMGRTGRKRDGRCVVLLTEGSEVASYNSSKSRKKSIFSVLQSNLNCFQYFSRDLPLVPTSVSRDSPKFIKDDNFDAADVADSGDDTAGNFRFNSHSDSGSDMDDDGEIDISDLLEHMDPTRAGKISSPQVRSSISTKSADEDPENDKRENFAVLCSPRTATAAVPDSTTHEITGILARFGATCRITETPVYHISHSKRSKFLANISQTFPVPLSKAIGLTIPSQVNSNSNISTASLSANCDEIFCDDSPVSECGAVESEIIMIDADEPDCSDEIEDNEEENNLFVSDSLFDANDDKFDDFDEDFLNAVTELENSEQNSAHVNISPVNITTTTPAPTPSLCFISPNCNEITENKNNNPSTSKTKKTSPTISSKRYRTDSLQEILPNPKRFKSTKAANNENSARDCSPASTAQKNSKFSAFAKWTYQKPSTSDPAPIPAIPVSSSEPLPTPMKEIIEENDSNNHNFASNITADMKSDKVKESKISIFSPSRMGSGTSNISPIQPNRIPTSGNTASTKPVIASSRFIIPESPPLAETTFEMEELGELEEFTQDLRNFRPQATTTTITNKSHITKHATVNTTAPRVHEKISSQVNEKIEIFSGSEDEDEDDPFKDLIPSPVTPVWFGKSLTDFHSTNIIGDNRKTQNSSVPPKVILVPSPPTYKTRENTKPKCSNIPITMMPMMQQKEKNEEYEEYEEYEEDSFVVPDEISTELFESSDEFEEISISPIKPLTRLKRTKLHVSPKKQSPCLPQPHFRGIMKANQTTNKPNNIQKKSKQIRDRTRAIHLSVRPGTYFLDNEAGCLSDSSSDDEDEDSTNLSFIVSQATPEKNRNMQAIYSMSLLSEASQQQVKNRRKKKSKAKRNILADCPDSPISIEDDNIPSGPLSPIDISSPPRNVNRVLESPQLDSTDWFDSLDDSVLEHMDTYDSLDNSIVDSPASKYSLLLSNSPQGSFREISSSSSM